MTPEQRSALASKAAKARWAKVKKRPKEIVPRGGRPAAKAQAQRQETEGITM
jgi:hypothetical protein